MPTPCADPIYISEFLFLATHQPQAVISMVCTANKMDISSNPPVSLGEEATINYTNVRTPHKTSMEFIDTTLNEV